MRIKKKAAAVATVAVIAVGMALAGAGSASAYTDYYGSNNCLSSGRVVTASSYGVGNVKHEIQAGPGYYTWSWSNGSTRQIRKSTTYNSAADWATFVYSDFWTQTSWYCG